MDAEFYIRDAHLEDFKIIRHFITVCQTSYIGPQRRQTVEQENFFRHYATYRLLAFDKEQSGNVVAYAEFRNYPYLWALPGEHWLDFLKAHYCLTIPISVSNVLFLNYCTIANELNPGLLKSLLREVFFRENQLRYILTIELPDPRTLLYFHKEKEKERINYYMFEGISQVFYPRIFSIENCKNTQKLHVMHRTQLIEAMSYRKALPEDNDDVIEVIDVDRPDLREELGDYFIAEELLRPGIQHNMLIITEVMNLTAGFVWLNDNVDVILLLENYEVDMFANLIKFDPKEPLQEAVISVVALEKKPCSKLFTEEGIKEAFEHEYTGKLFIADKLSSLTVHSQSNINVMSMSGIIATGDDRYILREEFLQMMQKVSNRLLSSTHYSYRFEKNVNLCFNVPAEHELEMDAQYADYNSNIFALQLFGMHRNNDTRRLFRLILAAFAAYPNRDYCLFSIPVGTPMTDNLRFLLKYFVRMSPRPRCNLTDELYITHRSSIYGEITLHSVRANDINEIERIMLYNIPRLYDELLTQRFSISTRTDSNFSYNAMEFSVINAILEDVFNNPFSEYTVETIRCGKSDEPTEKNVLVGFVIVRPFRYAHLLTTHYKMPVTPYSTYDRAEIVTLRLHPFFHHQFSLIMRELARLTNCFEFYYIQSMRFGNISLPNDLVLFMQPVEPIPYKKISKAIPPFDPSDSEPDTNELYQRLNYVTDHYAVYCHTLCHLKFSGSTRPLVIIGFSPICKAFLRTCVFSWNIPGVKASNKCSLVPQLKIIVVTEPGVIEAEYDKDLVCEKCKEKGLTCYIDGCNWSDYVGDVTTRMDIRKYVHYMSGHIRSIDRETHHVIFNNNCDVYYEQLLLLCDTSFGCPKSVGINHMLPSNYIQINSRLDRIVAYHKVCFLHNHLTSVTEKSIVVYGAHLRTYEFIQFLLEHEIPPEWITLVIPNQRGVHISEAVFNQPVADDRLEMILQDMIIDLGVKVYENLTFSNWHCYEEDGNISSVSFLNAVGEEIELQLELFASFYEAYIDWKLLDVLHNSGIKTNYRNIIVDDDFRTSDKSIYALGNYIQHKKEPNHQYKFVSHKEAAEKLVYKLGLIPAQLNTPYEAKFAQPHSCEVVLPMGYRMFKAIVPKRYMVNHLDNEFTHSLITYTYDGTFSRVRLNPFGIVEEIVCVTQQEISFQFLLHFVGHHELLLNNLRARWCHEEIKCFLEYFQEPWTELIMNEDFGDLTAENRKILLPLAEECMTLDKERSERRAEFKRRALKKELHKQMDAAFLKFIREHRHEIREPIALPEDFLFKP